jgi:inner membrane protein
LFERCAHYIHGSISGDMDNVTHAFIGAAMGECAVPPGASARARTILIATGVLAANAPDVDLLYTAITEAPLGYLLHHRGHSHTLPGLAVLGVAIWSGLRVLPRAKSALQGIERRGILLIAAALVGHLLMDSANSYGTHLLYPLSARWIYGDAVFVLEPWLWAILGAGLASNAVRVWRVLVALLALGPIAALVSVGLLRPGVLVAMLGTAGAMAVAARAWDRRKRAAMLLVTAATIFVLMPGVSRLAKAAARRALSGVDRGEVVDIVSDANPGVPWCWAVLTLQKAAAAPDHALIARRATLSLLPGVWPAASCASARLMSARWTIEDAAPSDMIVWHRRWRIDLEELRALHAGNCRVRAWLQFGRVPHVANGTIADLRFEHPVGQNFTPMAVETGARGCPSHVTNWELPRRDVLLPAGDSP